MKNNTSDIKHLLAACRKGDRESQMQLHRRFYSFGLNICLRYARNREEAREILNDAYLKVFRYLEKRQFDGAFVNWFRKILINAAIDYQRRYNKLESFEPLEEGIKETGDLFAYNFEYEAILKAIQQLPPRYRMVFNLYEMDGYKHREIAEMLKITVGTSKSNLAKAKMKLQKMLQPVHRKAK